MNGKAAPARLKMEDYFASDNDFNFMKARKSTLSVGWPIHFHNHYEIELILEGEGIHCINGREMHVSPGSLYLITPSDLHSLTPISPLTLINLQFPVIDSTSGPGAFLKETHGAVCLCLTEQQLPHFRYAFELILSAYNARPRPAPLYLTPLVDTMTGYLLSASDAARIEPPEEGAAAMMRTLQSFIQANFTRPIRLKDAADCIYVHPCYLSGMFPRWFGMGFTAYVNRYRLERAAALLARTDLPVTDVAFESGFGSVSQLIRCFHTLYHTTPLAYRKASARKMPPVSDTDGQI